MTAKQVKIFDKIRNKLEPILVFEDLDLQIYHPNVLPKSVSLAIFDSQVQVDYLNDQVYQKSQQLSELRNAPKLDVKNLEKRKEITKEIQGLNDQIDAEICNYVEQLAKLKPGSLVDKIKKSIGGEDINDDYPVEKIISDVFSEINTALREFNAKEFKVDEETENPT